MAEHLDEHKHKYGAGCIIGTIAIVLIVVFAVVLAVAASVVAVDDGSAAAIAIKSAVTATKIETVSVIPAKGTSSSRRRLMAAPKTLESTSTVSGFSDIFGLTDGLNGFLKTIKSESASASASKANSKNDPSRSLRRRLTQNVVATSALPATSAYNLQPEPGMYVAEDAAEALNMVNMIGCYMGQLRVAEVGINATCNPGSKPYVSLVQDSVCSPGSTTFSSWYVDYTGPVGYGDGEYYGNAMFNSGGMKIAIRMTATITGGAKVYNQVNYFMNQGTMQMGGFFREVSDGSVAKLWFMSHEINGDLTAAVTSGNLDGDSLYAEYNPTTFTGLCDTTVDGTKYQLVISNTAIYKKTTPVDGSGNPLTPVDTCIDFREASQMVIANAYFLYNAESGDSLTFQSGFPVLKNVDSTLLSAVPILKGIDTLEAYIDYWGLYWNGAYNSTSANYIDNENMGALIGGLSTQYASGIAVEKESYTSAGNVAYDLKVAPGRLEKITMRTITLGDIKGLPLTVNNWGNAAVDGDIIKWDGTSFKKIGDSGLACINYDQSNYDSAAVVNKDIASQKDCRCYDTSTNAVSTSMTITPYSGCGANCRGTQSFTKMAGANASASIDYTIDSTIFSRGIDVKTESDVLYGQVKLVYEPVVTLFGLDPGNFIEGQTVTQTISGVTATGTVFKSTDPALYGLACASNTCITMTPKSQNSCANAGTPNAAGQSLPLGTTLTQGSTVAIVTSWSWISPYNSIPVKFISGTAFTAGTDIITSWDETNALSVGGDASYIYSVAGTITWSTTTGLENTWDGLIYGDSGCAYSSGSGHISGFAIAGTTGGQVTLGFSSGTSKFWGYVNNQGSACTLTGPIQTDAATFAGTGITCATYPKLNVKCNRRVEASSRDIEIKMPSSTANAFTKCNDRNCPVLVNSVEAGSPYWKQKKQGGIETITDSTQLVYRQQTVVNAGDTVPALSCFDNCPTISSAANPSTYATYAAPSVLDPNAWISTSGECTTKPTSVTFSNIGGSAAANLVWEETGASPTSYYLSTFELTNLGTVCTTSTTPTITFNGGTCSTNPAVTLSCNAWNDAAAGTQKRGYTFAPITGLLTDSTSANVAVTNSGNNQYGPFFEGTAQNLAKLVCDYDDALLCSYKVWEKLSTFYFYSTGPQNTRPTLFDSSNVPVVFDMPKMMTYTHGESTTNSGKNFENSKFLLSYRGEGELEGLPNFCIDKATGAPGNCYYGASTPIAEFTIPTEGILEEITGGLKYYAKPAELAEYYPYYMNSGSVDNTECTNAGLAFGTFTDIDADWSTMYEKPAWASITYPTSSELTSNYFLAGKPAVVKDTPIFNIEGMNGECPSS